MFQTFNQPSPLRLPATDFDKVSVVKRRVVVAET